MLSIRPAPDLRRAHDAALAAALSEVLAGIGSGCIGFYWPIRNEFDAVAVISQWLCTDPARRAALPIIHTRAMPLDFHLWTPETPMRAGHFGIPEPDGTPAIIPDVLLIPCVGADRNRYRMGYGGGYYDRTLATMSPRPLTIGIAYADCVVDSIAPEPHDIALDRVVTENGAW